MRLLDEMRTTSTSNSVAAPKGGRAMAVRAAAGARRSRRWAVKTILVPMDFSSASKEAFEYALDLAAQNDARVHLLHVVENETLPDFEAFPIARTQASQVATVLKDLVGFARGGGHSDVPVYPEVRVGTAWREITEAARRDGVDLIVMPTHGYTGVKRMLIGSVAEQVLRHSPCPVLALRREETLLRRRRPRNEFKGKEKCL